MNNATNTAAHCQNPEPRRYRTCEALTIVDHAVVEQVQDECQDRVEKMLNGFGEEHPYAC